MGRLACVDGLSGGGNERVTYAPLHVVTGAFGYTGRYIVEELIDPRCPGSDVDEFVGSG